VIGQPSFLLRRFSIVELLICDYFEVSIKEETGWRWITAEHNINYQKQERKITDDFPEGIG
jgi:hypothetical protein